MPMSEYAIAVASELSSSGTDISASECMVGVNREVSLDTRFNALYRLPETVSHPSDHFVGTTSSAELLHSATVRPSIEQPPELELKTLPEHLRYAYLEEDQKLPVIIAQNLSSDQEAKLLDVLRTHMKAIGWTLADIPGISPTTCMLRILLEDGAKPVRQPQRRLNPLILDVVKKEVTKLLQAGIIYQISDSQWISPIQVVPKKSGVTVVANDKNELIPTRIQNSWRVCIDYRRLNQATRKDHYLYLLLIRCLSG